MKYWKRNQKNLKKLLELTLKESLSKQKLFIDIEELSNDRLINRKKQLKNWQRLKKNNMESVFRKCYT